MTDTQDAYKLVEEHLYKIFERPLAYVGSRESLEPVVLALITALCLITKDKSDVPTTYSNYLIALGVKRWDIRTCSSLKEETQFLKDFYETAIR